MAVLGSSFVGFVFDHFHHFVVREIEFFHHVRVSGLEVREHLLRDFLGGVSSRHEVAFHFWVDIGTEDFHHVFCLSV